MKIRLMLTILLLMTVFAGCRSTQQYTPIDTFKHSPPGRSTGHWSGQKTCPITGEALGSMGDPVVVQVQGHMVWVCCEGCVDAVTDDPHKSVQYVQKERGRMPGTEVEGSAAYDRTDTSRVSSPSGSCSSCRSR